MTTPQTHPVPDVFSHDARNPASDPLTPGVIVPPVHPNPPDPSVGERRLKPEEECPMPDEDEGTFGE